MEYGDLRSPYSVAIQENTDQKKLRIWTLFTQWILKDLRVGEGGNLPLRPITWDKTASPILNLVKRIYFSTNQVIDGNFHSIYFSSACINRWQYLLWKNIISKCALFELFILKHFFIYPKLFRQFTHHLVYSNSSSS